MSETTNETGATASPEQLAPEQLAPEQAAPEAASTGETPVKAKPARVRKALTLLKSHPLGLIVGVGAAVALVEIELAVGILTGIGATALLATKSGPDARQEVRALGQEVFTKGKAAIERARVALASRAKSQGTDAGVAAASPTPASAPATAEAASETAAAPTAS